MAPDEQRTESALKQAVQLKKQPEILHFQVHHDRVVFLVLLDRGERAEIVPELAVEEHLGLLVHLAHQAIFQ